MKPNNNYTIFQVRSNGPITGGYLWRNRLRIELFRELKRKKQALGEEERKSNDIQKEIQRVEGQVNQIQNEYLKADSDHSRYELMLENNRNRLNWCTTKLLALQRAKESNEVFCKRLDSSVASMKAKLEALDQELAQVLLHFPISICLYFRHIYIFFNLLTISNVGWQDFSSQLVPVEREEINKLNNEIRLLKNDFQIVSDRRIELEQQKIVIDSKLSNYLLKKKEDLLVLIHGNNDGEAPIDSQLVDEMRTDLARIQKELTSSDRELDSLRLELATSLDELNTKKNNWERAKDQRKEQEKKLNEFRDMVSASVFAETSNEDDKKKAKTTKTEKKTK